MVPKAKKIRCRRGVSLIGTLIAVAVLLIALIGTSSFRYHAALDGRRANAYTAAARIALVLCESWRGIKGDLTFDPTEPWGLEMEVTADDGLIKPEDFNLLGSYKVVLDDDDPDSVNYYTTLSWKDIKPGLRALSVVIAWAQRGRGADGTENVDKSFRLVVYTQTF